MRPLREESSDARRFKRLAEVQYVDSKSYSGQEIIERCTIMSNPVLLSSKEVDWDYGCFHEWFFELHTNFWKFLPAFQNVQSNLPLCMANCWNRKLKVKV